jgi:hypothetical protein
MGRNKKDFDEGQDYSDDPVVNRLAARGIVKNTHGSKKPGFREDGGEIEYMQEPDSDRY